jgi:hypothetical protein
MVQGLADTIRGREDIVAAIVVDSGREIKPPGPMFSTIAATDHAKSDYRSEREENADHAKQRVRGWAAKDGGG